MTGTGDGAGEPAVPLKTWIAVGGALIGAFMAVLNIQITNASLPYIEGGIGTGGVYGTWVSTAYLIGEIIVIPMTDFLSRVFSLRRYLLVNTALFLLFSALCGQASSLGEMILLRGLQGFSGGVLIPLAFTIVVSMLPPSKQPIGLAGFAVSATFAPAIGPTVGGYFTENYGWPYSFYVNLVPGAVMLAALWYALPRSPMRLGLLAKGDWRGIALMAVGLAAFQTVLDDGNVFDWFGSPFIVKLSLLAAAALGAFIVLEFITPEPLVNLRLLGRRNFGFGTLGNFLLGFALYGSAYLLPEYLLASQGYNSEQVGEVLAWTGLPQLLVIPLLPLLMKRIDARLLVATGLVIFAVSCFMNLELDQNYAAPQLLWPNVVRAMGQAIVLTPLSAIAMLGISREEAGAASGLFNMMRNLGGAIGTAAIETFFTKREQYHSFIINQHVSLVEPATRNRLAELQQYFMAHGVPRPGGGAASGDHRGRRQHPRRGDDHGLCRQLRFARGRPVGRGPVGCDAQKGRRFRRRRTLSEAARPLLPSEPFDRQVEDIAEAALGADDAGRVRSALQLAPQPQDLHIDAPVEDILMHAGGLQQVFAAERPLGRFEKGQQHGVFALGQDDGRALGIAQAARGSIEHPAAEAATAPLRIDRYLHGWRRALPAPKHGPDARQQLAKTEGLGQVVVGAKLEPDHPVDLVISMTGGDDHGDVGMRADLPQQVEPIFLAETQIEDHKARFVVGDLARHLLPPGGRDGVDVVFLEIAEDRLSQPGIVVDDQNAGGLPDLLVHG